MTTEFDAVVSNAFSQDTTHYILNFLNGNLTFFDGL